MAGGSAMRQAYHVVDEGECSVLTMLSVIKWRQLYWWHWRLSTCCRNFSKVQSLVQNPKRKYPISEGTWIHIQNNLGWGKGNSMPKMSMIISAILIQYRHVTYRHTYKDTMTASMASHSKNCMWMCHRVNLYKAGLINCVDYAMCMAARARE